MSHILLRVCGTKTQQLSVKIGTGNKQVRMAGKADSDALARVQKDLVMWLEQLVVCRDFVKRLSVV